MDLKIPAHAKKPRIRIISIEDRHFDLFEFVTIIASFFILSTCFTFGFLARRAFSFLHLHCHRISHIWFSYPLTHHRSLLHSRFHDRNMNCCCFSACTPKCSMFFVNAISFSSIAGNLFNSLLIPNIYWSNISNLSSMHVWTIFDFFPRINTLWYQYDGDQNRNSKNYLYRWWISQYKVIRVE